MDEIEALIKFLLSGQGGELVLALGVVIVLALYMAGILWIEWRDR